MKVSIVIPNYNGIKLLGKNLPDVLKCSPGCEVIVVDDASSDGSADFISATYPSVNLIRKKTNEGFSSAVNTGVVHATGELIMLLNSDVAPEENYLKPLIASFADPAVFAVGSLQKCREIGRITERGRGVGIFRRGFLYHGKGENMRGDTLWVSGGAGMFSKKIWMKLGGLSPIYNPFYWEDIDLSYLARKAGFKVLFEPASVVYHDQTEGAIRSQRDERMVKSVAYRNQILFTWLNISDFMYLTGLFVYLPVHAWKSVRDNDKAFIKGIYEAFKRLPQALKIRAGRKKIWRKSDREIFKSLDCIR